MAENNTIKIHVELDDQQVPEKILWEAGQPQMETTAFFLALFDPPSKDTLKIDLWTKEMTVQDMTFFTYNTLKSMGKSYAKATQDPSVVELFDRWAEELLERQSELPKHGAS